MEVSPLTQCGEQGAMDGRHTDTETVTAGDGAGRLGSHPGGWQVKAPTLRRRDLQARRMWPRNTGERPGGGGVVLSPGQQRRVPSEMQGRASHGHHCVNWKTPQGACSSRLGRTLPHSRTSTAV